MKRNAICALIVAAMVLLCSAFASAAGAKASFTIGHIMPGPDPFYQADLDAVIYCANLVGARVVALNSELKPEKEISNVEDLISQKVDAILIDSMSEDLAAQDVKLANAANIPMIMIGSSPPKTGKVTSYVSFDFKKIGEMVGTYVSEHHPKAKVAWITGKPGAGIVEAFRVGLVAKLTGGAKLVAEQPTDWNREQSMGIMSNWLQSKLDFNVAFVNNEDMSGGVVQVMKENKVKIPIVTTGGSLEGINMIKAGEIEATMAASPAVEGATAMKITLDFLKGKKIDSYYELPLMAITKSNLDQAVTWKMDKNVLKLIGWNY